MAEQWAVSTLGVGSDPMFLDLVCVGYLAENRSPWGGTTTQQHAKVPLLVYPPWPSSPAIAVPHWKSIIRRKRYLMTDFLLQKTNDKFHANIGEALSSDQTDGFCQLLITLPSDTQDWRRSRGSRRGWSPLRSRAASTRTRPVESSLHLDSRTAESGTAAISWKETRGLDRIDRQTASEAAVWHKREWEVKLANSAFGSRIIHCPARRVQMIWNQETRFSFDVPSLFWVLSQRFGSPAK